MATQPRPSLSSPLNRFASGASSHGPEAGAPGFSSSSLSAFAGDNFDVFEFIDQVCSQYEDAGELDFLSTGTIDALEEDLRSAVAKVENMSEAVDTSLQTIRAKNEELSTELGGLVRKQAHQQEAAAKQFRTLERRFGRASETAIQIGTRLRHLDEVRQRASHGRALLRYFHEFVVDQEVTSSIFTDFPRTLVEAAPYIRDLESIALDLNVKGIEGGVARIEAVSGQILNGLLDEFDRANSDGDLARMRHFADAILANFQHKQGQESLFQRFVFYSLNPLVAARKRSIAFKNSALKDNLAHLFSQIRSIVRTTHGVVSKVFPDHSDEILSLLVSRLFNDTAFGLQPMLQDFLHPSHRGYDLPHNEYLQILVTAHRETASLVHELARGLNKGRDARVEADKRGPSGGKVPPMALTEYSFDTTFIHRQMRTVFQQFTGDYAERELKLFDQRMSKRLYAVLPHRLMELYSPGLPPPPEVVQERREALAKKQDLQRRGEGGAPNAPVSNGEQADSNANETKGASKKAKAKKGAANGQTKSDPGPTLQASFRSAPIATLREMLTSSPNEFNVPSITARMLQLRTSWREDVRAIPAQQLLEWAKEGRRWKLEDVDVLNGEAQDDLDADALVAETLGPGFGASKHVKPFPVVLYDLRGIPGQAVRWAFEACSRCIDLLTHRAVVVEASGPGSSPLFARNVGAGSMEEAHAGRKFVLKDVDENKLALDTLEAIFRTFCDGLFLSSLLPVVHLVAANMPVPARIRPGDASTSLFRQLAEDMELFEVRFRPENGTTVGYGDPQPVNEFLPALAVNSAQIKSTAEHIKSIAKTRTNFGPALVPKGLDLLVASAQAVEECVEQGLAFWRDVVFPTFTDAPNRASTCHAYLENRLSALEEAMRLSFAEQLDYAATLMQACAVGLYDKTDYEPAEDLPPSPDQISRWVPACAELIEEYLEIFSRVANASAREAAILHISYLARDVLLGNLKRSSVSLQGSLTLIQDISRFSKAILDHPFCDGLEPVQQTWKEMRLISQLFLVQPEQLRDLIGDIDGGLSHLPPTFLYECLSKRSDFRSGHTTRSHWVRTLFE